MHDAMIEFTVTEKGDVKDAKVAGTTDPAFGIAALRAVEQWKFKPARLNGKPISTKLTQPLSFNLNGDDVDTTTPLLLDRPRFVAALPPKIYIATQVDGTTPQSFESLKHSLELLGQTQTSFLKLPPSAVPPRNLHRVPPCYSLNRHDRASVEGSFLILLTEKGTVKAIWCTTATDPYFVSPAAVALAQWKYAPCEVAGKPVPAIITEFIKIEMR